MFGNAITAFEPEHRKLLRSSAQDFISGSSSLPGIRKLQAEHNFDRARYSEMGSLGWLGMAFDAETGLDLSDMVALHRELGRGVLPEPGVAAGVLAAGVLAGSDNPAMKTKRDAIVSGDSVVTLAWQGSAGAMTSADVSIKAEPVAGGWRLQGGARFVAWADKADAIVVAAQTPKGVILAWVDSNANGLTVRQANGLDRSSFCEVALDAVVVTSDQVVASPMIGAALLDRVLDVGRLAVSAELVGVSEALFAITLDYLKQRKQFGKPIGANQALQFTAVDLYIQIELANSVVAAAAAKLDSGVNAEERALVIAGCKSRCSDAALQMARQAIQLHGAIGYTDECDVSLFVKRAMLWAGWLGNGSSQRKRLQQAMLAA